MRNDTARKLRAGKSTTVGFVVLDGQNPFFGDVVRGARRGVEPRHRGALPTTDEDVARGAYTSTSSRGSRYGACSSRPAATSTPASSGCPSAYPCRARRPVQRRRTLQIDLGRQRRRQTHGDRAPHRDGPAADRLRRQPVRDPAGQRPTPGARRRRGTAPSPSTSKWSPPQLTVAEGAAAGTRILSRPRHGGPTPCSLPTTSWPWACCSRSSSMGESWCPTRSPSSGSTTSPRGGRGGAALVDAPTQPRDRSHRVAHPPRGDRGPRDHPRQTVFLPSSWCGPPPLPRRDESASAGPRGGSRPAVTAGANRTTVES